MRNCVVAAVGVAFSLTGFANAAICGAGANSVTTATDCVLEAGNDKNAGNGMNADGVFGQTDWVLAWSSDDGQESGAPDFGLSATNTPDGTSGVWSAANGFLGYADIVFTLKAGNAYAAYLLDSAVTTGTWTTANILTNGANARGISHVSVWFRGEPTDPVPLPGAFLLYGTAAAAAVALTRRRAAKA